MMCASTVQVAALPGEVVSNTGKQYQETKGRSRLGAYNYSPDLWERSSVFLLIAEIWDLITVHPLLLNLRFSEFFIFPPLHSSSFSPQTP